MGTAHIASIGERLMRVDIYTKKQTQQRSIDAKHKRKNKNPNQPTIIIVSTSHTRTTAPRKDVHKVFKFTFTCLIIQRSLVFFFSPSTTAQDEKREILK